MKNKLLLVIAFLLPAQALPLESIYVGGQLGFVGLTQQAPASTMNALGFGIDVGFRVNPVLDVSLRSGLSSHAGPTTIGLWSNTVSADFMVGHFNDIQLFLGGGPGFYQFAAATTETKFGLHANAIADLVLGENLRLGLGGRFHGIFDPSVATPSYWTMMMRVGFSFNTGP